MNALDLDGLDEEAALKKITTEIYILIFDVVEALTVDELTALRDTKNYEDFHKLCSENIMLMRVVESSIFDSADYDNVIVALELCSKRNNEPYDCVQDLVDAFSDNIEGEENYFIYMYLKSQDAMKKLVVDQYSLVGIKVIWGYIEELSNGLTLKYEDYKTMLNCPCGGQYNHQLIEDGLIVRDIRDHRTCCSKCGRGRSEFILVSCRQVYIVKMVDKKRIGRKSIKVEELIKMGNEYSEHTIIDIDKPKYQLPLVCKTPVKRTKKKTLGESVGI